MALIDSGKEFDKEQNSKAMKQKINNLDIVQYPLRIPSSLYKKVKIKLIHDETNLRTILVKMLEEYVNK